MKINLAVAAFLLAGFIPATAQSGSKPASAQVNRQQPSSPAGAAAAQGKIDPAKEADIRRLLELSGAKKLIADTMGSMLQNIRPMLASSMPPGEYREKLIDLFFAKFQSKADPKFLVDTSVSVYDKYFSHDEIKSLIKFYETPVGQKAISVLPQLMEEMRAQGQKWGEKLGRDSMQEVLAEHPEMEKALEAAAAKASQR